MKYVTTNIRLTESLWKTLKMEAVREGKRLAEIIRERLMASLAQGAMGKRAARKRSICGLWKGASIPDALITHAKRSLRRTKPVASR